MNLAGPGTHGASPAAYDPVKAFTLASLTSIAAERARGARPDVPVPYLVAADVDALATIFISPSDTVVAFAGVSDDACDAAWDTLGAALARLRRFSLPLVVAGHDAGAVHALGAPRELGRRRDARDPGVNVVYTYGAPPFGESGCDETPHFHHAVVGDRMPAGIDEYVSLLDPRAGADYDFDEPDEHVRAHYAAGLTERGMRWEHDVQQCTLDTADTGGRMRISWDRRASYPDPARYDEHGVFVATSRIIVRAGHELVIDAPHGQHVDLVSAELVLGPAARLSIRTSARLHLGRLIALAPRNGAVHTAPPSVELRGVDGAPGVRGGDGTVGGDGMREHAGSSGGSGGAGGAGQHGRPSPEAMLFIGELRGQVVVHTEGGAGGRGGAGGNGGAGGAGGSLAEGVLASGGDGGEGGGGGDGGTGGSGGTVHIVYRRASADMRIECHAVPARGGDGGAGGAGGPSGYGHPAGDIGVSGRAGTQGSPGRAGEIICTHRGVK